MAAPEIHTITRIGANGNYSTGETDIGPHRGGGGGGSCSWNEITGKPNFARVATTGSYNDLSNKPTIPAPYDDSALSARVTALEQSGGSGTSYDDTAIKARMTAAENRLNGLAAVATSGSYNDLSNKPTIPAAYNDTALVNRVTALENKTDQDTKPVLVSALTVNNAMGQATAGKTYPVGTSVEAILRDILTGATPTTYTITFNANGGSVTPTSATTGTDSKLASLPTPTHATDTFKGWFTAATGGTAVTTNTVFTQNTIIFAQWQAVPQPVTGLPIFATATSVTGPLEEVTIDYAQAEYILNVPAQTETNPVIIEVPTEKNFVLTIWNPLLNQWVSSTNKWDVSTTTRTINGNSVAYTRYTENCECDSPATRVRFTWS